jgi:adenine phosphoribosyltransferase
MAENRNLQLPDVASLARKLRDIKDFPKPGIVFKDVTPLLADSAALSLAVEFLTQPFRSQHIDKVVGAESRGFIFGTAVARNLSAGFVPIRKPGKLPFRTRRMSYQLEYGTDSLEIHEDAIKPGEKVLMIDDLLATGGTMVACCDLVRELKGEIAGVAVLIELCFLNGRKKFPGLNVHSVIKIPAEDQPVAADF